MSRELLDAVDRAACNPGQWVSLPDGGRIRLQALPPSTPKFALAMKLLNTIGWIGAVCLCAAAGPGYLAALCAGAISGAVGMYVGGLPSWREAPNE